MANDMREKNIETLLNNVLSSIIPTEKEMRLINEKTWKFNLALRNHMNAEKIRVEVFVGGSLAKNTLIKKKDYDIDIFIRFIGKVDTKALQSIIKKIDKNVKIVHGSRDYFIIKDKRLLFEIVPVKKINRPEKAENSVDLSYFHVKYVKNKINKNKKLANEIRLTKAFCYSAGCYGAESFMKGFSGYALELLIIHYKSLLTFLKEIARAKEKIIIDSARYYKNNEELLVYVNEAKINGPIILIDPTFKERNAAAALSYETFKKFQQYCIEFLKKPSESFFEKREVDIKILKTNAKKLKAKLIKIKLKTNRQEGDIAGTKLRKASEFLVRQITEYAEIKGKEFIYDDKKSADIYLILKEKDKIFKIGPPLKMMAHVAAFKRKHKQTIIRNKRIYAMEKIRSINSILNEILKEKRKQMREIGVNDARIVKN